MLGQRDTRGWDVIDLQLLALSPTGRVWATLTGAGEAASMGAKKLKWADKLGRKGDQVE